MLTNIGPYQGQNIFDFNTKEDLNTTLIGGKNGSGKTTFLNSVRLALYGPLAYGFKTTSNEYLKKISALLNSTAAKDNSSSIKNYEEEFQVQIDFSMIENFKRINVSIIRNWTLNDGNIKEKVTVIKDGIEASEVEKDKFFTHLRTTFPPSLLELCFFDGEEISHLTDEDNLSNYLKVLSAKIFNLDLFQNLEQDLTDYLNQSSKSKEQSKLEEDKNHHEAELNQLIETLQKLNKDYEETKSELESNKQKYSDVKNDFSIHGGVAYEERTQIQNRINEIEGERKHLNEKIKEFIATELPFFIAFPKLAELVTQLKQEEDFHVANILKEKIGSLPVDEIVNTLGVDSDDEKEKQLKESLINHLAPSDEVHIFHNASKTEAQQVYSLMSATNLNRLEEVFKMLSENRELLVELQKLKKKLKDNEESPEFTEMIQSMEEYNRKISELQDKLVTLEDEINQTQSDIEVENKKFEKVKQQLYNIQKRKSSFEESQKIIQISQKFQEQQLRNKIRDIEYFSSKMFKNLLRKRNFINHIQIDSQSFGLSILDHNNEPINKDILSAGEKELLALSIIWGTITSSKKELPLILDTLLGRLDNEHKHSIVTKLLPELGVQNIVLSTDSEIDEKLYEDLQHNLANEYTLNYDSTNRKTNIENHFFNLSKKKVES